MKKKSRKTVQKKLAAGVVAILALSFGLGSSPQGSLRGAEQAAKKVPNVRHEMVPHVVLPETIQYNKIAQSSPSHPGLLTASDYGMVSPFVATYTPFPSYQIPLAAELKGVNQSVYPVSPKLLPKPLPPKAATPKADEKPANEAVESDITMEKKDSSTGGTEAAPILLASNSEEIVQATPSAPLPTDVTQTGIFCQKPAKPPAAWSFTSPVFKAASVPTGWGGPAGGYGGYINQSGPRGCSTQLGFQPAGQNGEFAQQGAPYPYPTNTYGAGQGFGDGPQAQVLPNGMVLLTVPHDHSQCGLLRCRGNSPRMVLLPPGPAGIPGFPGQPGAQPVIPGLPSQPPQTPPGAMLMPGFGGFGAGMLPMQAQWSSPTPYSNPIQPQLTPIVAMTPYGATIVGYQPAPSNPASNPMGEPGMYGGAGMVSLQQFQALQYQQQLQQLQQQFQVQQIQQYQAMQAALQAASAGTQKSGDPQNAENQDEAASDLQTPLPINSQVQNLQIPQTPNLAAYGLNPYANYAVPYGLYAQQAGAAGQDVSQAGVAGTANPLLNQIPPQMFALPQAFPQANYGGGAYMTPYGMVVMGQPSPFGGQFGNTYGGGMMAPVAYQPGFQQPGLNQGGLSMSDVIQLVALLNNNQQRHRRGLFARLAERREARHERNAQHDPLNQLMQAWTTPYMSPDASVRMPSRNAYPYGYFGAQAGPQDTANYGGYYNLYMGNTSYPGLY